MAADRQGWWTDDPRIRMLFSVAGATGLRGLSSYFFAPKLLLGANGLDALQNVAPTLSRKKTALIITDKSVVNLAEKVKQAMQKAGFKVDVWNEVIPEPPLENIMAGVEVANKLDADLLVAVGGGSVMDATKAIWLKYARPDMDIRDCKPVDAETLDVMPLGLRFKANFIAIPTTSGTGSETTATAVITDKGKKKVLNHPEFVADLAILDPAFTVGLPPKLTAYTGLDALAHATGAVLTHWANEYTLPLGYQAIKLVFKYLPRAVANCADYEARYKMAIASNMAGMAFGNGAPSIEHAMGHAFGKMFNVHHGCAVGLFTPYMMQCVSKHSEMFLDLAENLGVGGKSKREILDNLVQKYVTFIKSIDCPVTIQELGISREQLDGVFEELLDDTLADAVNLLSIRPMTREVYRKLYLCALTGEKVDF